MNLNDYVHLAIAEEAQSRLRKEPGELPQTYERRLDRYVERRMKQLGETLVALDQERRG